MFSVLFSVYCNSLYVIEHLPVNQITTYYDQNTWDFTRLARIGDATKDALLEAFGDGNVTVKLWIEWSE